MTSPSIHPAHVKELILMRDIALREHGPNGRSTRMLQESLETCTLGAHERYQHPRQEELLEEH
jgi:hypothetical protein